MLFTSQPFNSPSSRELDDQLIANGFCYLPHAMSQDEALYGGSVENNRELVYNQDVTRNRSERDRLTDHMQAEGWLDARPDSFDTVYAWIKNKNVHPNTKKNLLARYFGEHHMDLRVQQLVLDNPVREEERDSLCTVFDTHNDIRFLASNSTIDNRIEVFNEISKGVFSNENASHRAGKRGLIVSILDYEEHGKLLLTLDAKNYLNDYGVDRGSEYDNLAGFGIDLVWDWSHEIVIDKRKKKHGLQNISHHCYASACYRSIPTARSLEVAVRAAKTAIDLRVAAVLPG